MIHYNTTVKYFLLLCFLTGLTTTSSVSGQHNSSLIYGTIFTNDDDAYTGFIRWGKEEMYWHDIFNSVKTNKLRTSISDQKKKSTWDDMDWSLSSIWKNTYQESPHTFACLFGDIASMSIRRGEKVLLEFKNGALMEVDGGSNDVGAKLVMHDFELGKISFDWDDLERIEFSQAPENLDPPYGTPLYGTVMTDRRKSFTGHIKWDLDERNGKDILDGESKLGDQKIPFEKIKIIEKRFGGDAVDLTFESGRIMKLDGSNDCDSGNRGIGVFVRGLGSIEIEWDDFTKVIFQKEIEPLPFVDFQEPRSILADVLTFDGDIYSGYIAYDKDEIWDLEFIDGDDDDIEYQVPVRNIKKIIPKNHSFSKIVLRNGEDLLLGDRQDVDNDNDGILLFKNKNADPIYIPWEDVDEIIFK